MIVFRSTIVNAISNGCKNFSKCDFTCENLCGLDFSNCDLSGAKLDHCNLEGTNLEGTNLEGADIRKCIGNGIEIVTFERFRPYRVAMMKGVMAIGCEQHSIDKWENFTDREIHLMDQSARSSITFWNDHRRTILKTHKDYFE